MRPLLILIFVCFYCSKLCAQTFYVTDNNGKLRKITLVNDVITNDVAVNGGCLGSAQSLAFQRNVVYYTDGLQLKRGDIVNNTVTNCDTYGTFQSFIGLTVDKKGVLYLTASNKVLYTYDPATKGPLVVKGSLPNQPSADMIFYKDELYVSTTVGIYKVNIQDPAQSKLVIPTGTDILGMTVVSVNSTVNKVYAFSVVGSASNMIELDLDNNVMGKTIGLLPYYVYDAASNVEDGSYITLDIDEIKTTTDCPYTGRGTVQIINHNATSNYRYTLGNQTNQTGIFYDVTPGPYQVTITNGPDNKQTQLTVPPFVLDKPVITVTSTNPRCLNKGNVAVTIAADPEKYTIFFEGNSYPLNRNFDLGAGTHHFEVRNLSGCTVYSRDVTLTLEACQIILDSLVVKQDCSDPKRGAVTAHTSPGTDKYHFALAGAGANTTGIFNGLGANTYIMKITSDGGGTKDVPFTVKDLSANDPKVTYIKSDATCSVSASVKFDVPASNLAGYTVMYRSASYPISHTFQFLDSGKYSFRILKPGGCLLKDTTVQINKLQCQTVFFPNTFTPNNDGINDIFRPAQGTTADKLKFRVFNRLGTLIYTSENTKTGWDGSYQGKPAPAGVYYWMASYINNEGFNLSQNGSVALIR